MSNNYILSIILKKLTLRVLLLSPSGHLFFTLKMRIYIFHLFFFFKLFRFLPLYCLAINFLLKLIEIKIYIKNSLINSLSLSLLRRQHLLYCAWFCLYMFLRSSFHTLCPQSFVHPFLKIILQTDAVWLNRVCMRMTFILLDYFFFRASELFFLLA